MGRGTNCGRSGISRRRCLHSHSSASVASVRVRLADAGLAVAAGAAWALAAPPRAWWPLLPLGVAALTVALHGRTLPARAALGAVTGLAFYAPTLWWIADFAVPGYAAVVLLESGLLSAASALVPAATQGRWSGGWWALPAVLVLLEAVQYRFPFGGFPLPALALSQVDGPFAAAAPLAGSPLVTAIAAIAGVAFAALVLVKGRRRRLAIAGTYLAIAGIPVLVGGAVTTQPAGSLDVALVQGGGPRGVFTDPQEVLERHLTVAATITGSPDLVVLPENVTDVAGPITDAPAGEDLSTLAARLNTALVAGVTEAEANRFRNAAVLWGPDGRVLDRYEKEHPVPFGEYMPARKLLERITDATDLVPRDAIRGRGHALLRSPTAPLGVVISYEVFFPGRVHEAVAGGGQIVLVPTNAASYVTDEVPATEVAAARLRAREFGRTVLQAAPTGYSAVISPNGQVVQMSRLGTPALLRERVPLRTGLTPYARIGDAPLIALALATVVSAALLGRHTTGPVHRPLLRMGPPSSLSVLREPLLRARRTRRASALGPTDR